MAKSIDMATWRHMLKVWKHATPATVAHIMNSTTLQIDRKRRTVLTSHLHFRSAGTKKYLLGDGKPNNKRSALFYYPAKAKGKSIHQLSVLIGAKKNRFNLDLWDQGGKIKEDEQNPHFTAQARGGSFRKLPKKFAKLTKGKKLKKLPKQRSMREHFAMMQRFSSSGEPFYAPANSIAGTKKEAGIYIMKQGKMIMLRGMKRKDITIPRTAWHTGTVHKITNGGYMQNIVVSELTKLYKKGK